MPRPGQGDAARGGWSRYRASHPPSNHGLIVGSESLFGVAGNTVRSVRGITYLRGRQRAMAAEAVEHDVIMAVLEPLVAARLGWVPSANSGTLITLTQLMEVRSRKLMMDRRVLHYFPRTLRLARRTGWDHALLGCTVRARRPHGPWVLPELGAGADRLARSVGCDDRDRIFLDSACAGLADAPAVGSQVQLDDLCFRVLHRRLWHDASVLDPDAVGAGLWRRGNGESRYRRIVGHDRRPALAAGSQACGAAVARTTAPGERGAVGHHRRT